MKKQTKTAYIFFILLVFFAVAAYMPIPQEGEEYPAWYKDWGVPEGFAITKDSGGYSLPTFIVFVPEPGDGPKDPLYYVAELRGKIKVVTNDRTVKNFANPGKFPQIEKERSVERIEDEFGLTGLCLSPEKGYLFATFVYYKEGQLYNNIARFETTPGTFSLKPSNNVLMGEIFSDFPTGVSHQIGGCQVDGNHLYVSVGEGQLYELPHSLETPLGKVLRFTLDGEPAAENPFYDPENVENLANYVYAHGFRNPFGLKFVDGNVYAADNGNMLDRFIEIIPGEDYLWDGTDRSMGAKGTAHFYPAIGPAQMEFYRGDNNLFPEEYNNSFFIAMTAHLKGIMQFQYDFEEKKLGSVPQDFLEFLGVSDNNYVGLVVGVQMGPDGLYFSSFIPNLDTESAVYRISYDPANAHPFHPGDNLDPAKLLSKYGCLGCHSIDGIGNTAAPILDRDELIPRLNNRLNSEAYEKLLNEIDKLQTSPFVEMTEGRKKVRKYTGYERIIEWTTYHLLEPRFDNPAAMMPNLGFTEPQARALANHLIGHEDDILMEIVLENEDDAADQEPAEEVDAGFIGNLKKKLPPVGYRHLLAVFVIGMIAMRAVNKILDSWQKKHPKEE